MMGKPDSPLNRQLPGDSWREGRSAQSRSLGQPVWEQPEGRRPGPGRSQQSLGPRSTTGPRLQRVSWEGLQTLGFGGLSWLSCHQARGGKGFSTQVPSLHWVSERQGSQRGGGLSNGMAGGRGGRQEERMLLSDCHLHYRPCREGIVSSPRIREHKITNSQTSHPRCMGGLP